VGEEGEGVNTFVSIITEGRIGQRKEGRKQAKKKG
jgi:hypothetical protein